MTPTKTVASDSSQIANQRRRSDKANLHDSCSEAFELACLRMEFMPVEIMLTIADGLKRKHFDGQGQPTEEAVALALEIINRECVAQLRHNPSEWLNVEFFSFLENYKGRWSALKRTWDAEKGTDDERSPGNAGGPKAS